MKITPFKFYLFMAWLNVFLAACGVCLRPSFDSVYALVAWIAHLFAVRLLIEYYKFWHH